MIAVGRRGGDRDAILRWAAIVIWLIAVATIVITLASYVSRGSPSQGTGFVQGPLGVTAVAMTGLLYSSVGAYLLRRRSRDLIGWALLGIGIGMAVILPLDQLVEASIRAFRPVPTGMLVITWALTAVHMPASGFAVVAIVLLFPTGRFDWPYSRRALMLAAIGCTALAISSALRPEGLLWYPNLPNPLPIPASWSGVVATVSAAGVAAFVASLALAAVCVIWRYRHASTRQRRQLAWVAFGAAAMAGSVALLYIGRYAGAVAGTQGERLAFLGAAGAALLPIAMFRFATVTASHGQETRDLTFLFTDLQDSTAIYERIGDVSAFDLVRLHLDTLSAVARRHHGAIVKTIGDALMARFLDPAEAVQAALEMFERLARFNRANATQLVLKVGLHRGDAIVVSGRGGTDYFGQTVNIAARIGGVAKPGEIVLSDAVHEGAGVARQVSALEVHQEDVSLKGVSGTVTVHRLKPDGTLSA